MFFVKIDWRYAAQADFRKLLLVDKELPLSLHMRTLNYQMWLTTSGGDHSGVPVLYT